MTVEEYLEFERSSEVRHEFMDGVLIEMPGTSRTHGNIVTNLVLALKPVALARNCELQVVDVMTRTRETRYRYPDLAVSCAPGTDPYLLENPCLLVEMLSNSTEHMDRGVKLNEYLKLPSLERYVLIDQAARFVTLYWRDPSGWRVEILEESGEFEIPCLETSITLDQIYAGLEFAS